MTIIITTIAFGKRTNFALHLFQEELQRDTKGLQEDLTGSKIFKHCGFPGVVW
jgi:hypothetical protein